MVNAIRLPHFLLIGCNAGILPTIKSNIITIATILKSYLKPNQYAAFNEMVLLILVLKIITNNQRRKLMSNKKITPV